MSDLILKRSHGFQLDHVGLGVPNTEEGVAWVRAQTGAEIDLHDPEPDQWYWSGSLPIGEQSFLEIIGPNPSWTKFQPFRALLTTLSQPTLLFWYIAVNDFQGFKSLIDAHKAKLERVEAINIDGGSEDRAAYWRGLIGPGFMTERPNVIEWVRRPVREGGAATMCKLTDFTLSNPDADKINPVFESLGIETRAADGASSIGLTIETPKGPWRLENPGVKWTMPGMLADIAGLWWRTRRL